MAEDPRVQGRRLVAIAIVGAESTGKSTLAAALGSALGAPVSEEFARAYASRVGRPLVADDVGPIAEGQIALEDAAATVALLSGGDVVVKDTDLLSTWVYAGAYYGASVAAPIRGVALARRADLYIVCAPDLPFVEDGVRDPSADRGAMAYAFSAAVDEAAAMGGTERIDLAGSAKEARLDRALAAASATIARCRRT